MTILELFNHNFGCTAVMIVTAPLPHSRAAVRSAQYLAAIVSQSREDRPGCPSLQLTDNWPELDIVRREQKQVHMLRHDDITEYLDLKFSP